MFLVQGAAALLFALWGSVAASVGYYALRNQRENVDVRDLAGVFA
jgi:hypothetical protein